MYSGVPPWDIGRAQPEVVRIAEAGGFTGAVIDVGCGTGENALELSGRGLPVLGIAASPRAVEKARAKATERGLSAEFLVADALSLGSLDRRFNRPPVYSASATRSPAVSSRRVTRAA